MPTMICTGRSACATEVFEVYTILCGLITKPVRRGGERVPSLALGININLFGLWVLRCSRLRRIHLRKLANQLLFLIRKRAFEAIGIQHLLALVRGHLAQVANRLVHRYLAVLRQTFELLVGIA